jgi:FMN phosphatase YigB (HAD superfamily)
MIDLAPFELHIFDLDDTLVNTRYAYTTAQERAVKSAFPNASSERLVQALPRLKWLCGQFGSGNQKGYMSAFIAGESEDLPSCPEPLEQMSLTYNQNFKSLLSCFDGVIDYIRQLQSKGKTIALVSNGIRDNQLDKLSRVGIRTLFDDNLIFISGDYPPALKKPSPHMIEEALRESEIIGGKTLFYGNSTDDMLAGNLAGVTTAHFNGSTELPEGIPAIATPVFTFQNWADLPE